MWKKSSTWSFFGHSRAHGEFLAAGGKEAGPPGFEPCPGTGSVGRGFNCGGEDVQSRGGPEVKLFGGG